MVKKLEDLGDIEVMCTSCGEVYDLSDPTFEEVPLVWCGECARETFVTKNLFNSLEHYEMLVGVLEKYLNHPVMLGIHYQSKYLRTI